MDCRAAQLSSWNSHPIQFGIKPQVQNTLNVLCTLPEVNVSVKARQTKKKLTFRVGFPFSYQCFIHFFRSILFSENI